MSVIIIIFRIITIILCRFLAWRYVIVALMTATHPNSVPFNFASCTYGEKEIENELKHNNNNIIIKIIACN